MPCQFGASSVTMRSAVVMILWIIIGSINLSLGQDNPHNPAPPKQPPQNPPPPPDSQNPPPSPPDPSTAKQLDPRCSLDISNICTTDRGNHNVPKANDCSSFYKCAGNSAAKNETCSQGELFDKTLLQCVTTSDVSICLLCPSTGTSPTYSSVSSSSTVISSTSTRSPLPSSSTTTTRASAGNSSSTTSDMQSSSSGSVTNVTSEKTDASKSSTDSSLSTASMSKSATTSSTSTSSAMTTENVSSTEHSKNGSSNTNLLTGMSENPGSSVSSPVSVSQTTISKFDSSSTTTGNFGMGSSSSVAVPSSLSTTAGSVDMPSSSDVSFESNTASTVQTVTTSSAVPLSTKLLSRNIYFSSTPSDIVVEGTYVEFQCKFIWRTDIGGTAQLDNFKWVLDGRELDATGRISINQTSAPLSDGSYVSTLKFSPVLSGDAGNLTCCALTSGFINSTSFSYRVFVKPRVAINPVFVSAGPEDLVTLSCTADEVSDMDAFLVSFNRLTWLRSDQTILRTDNEHVNSSFPVVSTINETFLMSTNVTCVVELSLVNVTSNIAFVHITANDNEPGCQPQTANGVDWSFTKVGDSNFRPCPDDKAGIAVRLCAAANIWDQPDLSQCISKTLIDLKQQINVVKERNTALDNQTMTNLSVIIYNTIIDQVNMTEAEFQLSVEIITDMADIHVNSTTNTFLDKKELLTMMGTVSVLLDIPDSGKLSKSLAVLLLSSVDTYMSLYTKQIQSDSVFSVYQNMIVETGGFSSLKSTSSDRIEWQIPSWDKMDQTQQNSSSWADSYDNGIKVNPMTGHNRLNATMASNYTSSCIKTLGNLMPLTEDQIKNNSYINSYMVSLAIIGLNSGSTPPVNITLNHLKINKSMTGKCVYWNFSASDNGAWMDNGCETVYTNDTHTACNCSHLTNFAILMSPHPATGMDDVILSIVSMVGCLISVIALVLTIILYVSQWKKLKSKRAAVLLNLCVSLIIANIVFLAGSNQTKSEIGCKVVAALLHYFFLAAFFLMLLEGILLFMYVVCVFYVHRKSHTIVLLVSAWFIPAIIVAVSLGVTKTKGYGTEKTCWLSVGENVLWAFVGPALFVILVNLIIIIIVLVRLGSSKVRSDLKKKRNKIVSVLRNVVILSPILGVTWIFGVLSVSDGTVVFQYIFCIANSLQGLFIFVLHGLCHAKNKKSSVSSKQKRWTGPQSRVSVQRAHIPLTEGDSQEDLVRTNKAEKELYLEQNVVKQNSAYKVPFAHQLSNMSHVSNGTANTYMSNSLSANGTASPQ